MSYLLKNIRIARVSTIPFCMLTQLRSQLQALGEEGASVTVITSPPSEAEALALGSLSACKFKPISIARNISPLADLISLWRLFKVFKTEKFDIVHSTTPKAGLLCAIAAKIARVPVRMHTYTGQVWVLESGFKRWLLKSCDQLISFLNTHCNADSSSQREFLINQKIYRSSEISVLGSGSLAGVNFKKFNPSNYSAEEKQALRDTWNISPNSLVLLFVGRITQDKGVFELIESFSCLVKKGIDIILLMVGPFEQELEASIKSLAMQSCGNRIIFTDFCEEQEKFMAISDIFCLPSYREGFGTVVIEAAAMCLPVVATRIYGLTDAIIDGVTGLLVEPKNMTQLTEALERLIFDAPLRTYLQQQGMARALNEFDSGISVALLIEQYHQLLLDNLSEKRKKLSNDAIKK